MFNGGLVLLNSSELLPFFSLYRKPSRRENEKDYIHLVTCWRNHTDTVTYSSSEVHDRVAARQPDKQLQISQLQSRKETFGIRHLHVDYKDVVNIRW